MTYNTGESILASDVADRFWNSYFSGQIVAAQSYSNTGSRGYPIPSGKTFVTAYYWQREVVPRFGNAPNQARGSQPSRSITAPRFTGTPGGGTIRGGTSTGSIHAVIKAEVQRFATFCDSFTWQSYRYFQTYGPAGQGNIYQSAVRRYSVFNEFTANASNNINSPDGDTPGDTITTSEFDTLFNAFAQTYAAQRNASASAQATNYTICHNSCHSSCHRNRGRR